MTTQEFQRAEERQQVSPDQSQSQADKAMNKGVFEIAILGRVIWNLHSLNNEGTIGNVTEPRTVVLWDGTKTDGVSGEMMKHIHAFWTWLQAKNAADIPLCTACQRFQPQRADAARVGLPSDNALAVKEVLSRCALCDLHGFLVQDPQINRQSTVEFGWIVGVRDSVHREFHIHARHAVAERGATRATEEVAAQMVYHRPTRSGVYALVTLYQPWRIGLNEVDYTYVLDDAQRQPRHGLILTAYEWTFKRPDGAMITTRLPHIEGFEGVVLVSSQPVPVPLLSPLRDDYLERLQALAQKQGIEAHRFGDLVELIDILQPLAKAQPLRLFQS
jgi:CRISPR-associated protein Cst2